MTDPAGPGATATGPPRLVRAARPTATVPAVSVCVPVYQGERHLAATLRSVLDQTAADLELVVLDNASTDRTAEVLAGIEDPRLAVWRNPSTVPMIENFHRVVALSTAPLVKALPADDLLEPDALEHQVAALRAEPGLALVAGRAHLVDGHDRLLARDRFLRGLIGRHDRASVVRRVVRNGANPIGAEVSVLFRRDAFDAVGGWADCGMHADVDLWLRLLAHGDFLGLPRTLARFRIDAGAHSATADRETYRVQRAFTLAVAAGAADVVRRRDRLSSLVQAPAARRRRELLYALSRLRGEPRRGRPHPDPVRPDPVRPDPVLPEMARPRTPVRGPGRA